MLPTSTIFRRLSEEELIFPPYNALQIKEILKERAEKALGGHLDQKDYEKARIELLRAVIRVQVAEKHSEK